MDSEEHIDEFESMFRKSDKALFAYEETTISTVTLVTDWDEEESKNWQGRIQNCLPETFRELNWQIRSRDRYQNVRELLAGITDSRENLIVTWRNLGEEDVLPQHSLGTCVDVLTQATKCPVLLLPGSSAHPAALADEGGKNAMVATDHLANDHRLVNTAVKIAAPNATLWLCHVEDDRIFNRYMTAISKIPQINTDEARRVILGQLQDDANNYIQSAMDRLKTARPNMTIEGIVTQGHRIQTYKRLVEQHKVDLLILNTSDDEQLAMHGMAYSLSVEIQDIPLLLL